MRRSSHAILHFSTLAPQDYLPVSTEVTFNADEETRMCRDVTIRDDFILEGEETFLLEITTTAPELTIVAPVTIRITIEDNDGKLFQLGFGALPQSMVVIIGTSMQHYSHTKGFLFQSVF